MTVGSRSLAHAVCGRPAAQLRAGLASLLALAFALCVVGCERGSAPARPAAAAASAVSTAFYATPFERRPDAATLTALGRLLFADAALSASGKASCASCHDPAHAYGPPNDLPAQFGGVDAMQQGTRAVPSLRYQQDTPPFSEHFSDTDGDDSADQGPTGGRGWDGRAGSAHEQASVPLLSPFEMANADAGAAVARLRQSSASAAAFRSAFGEHVFDQPALAWNGLLLALEVFQQSPNDFYPYSSKYDAFLRRTATLSPKELRGLAVFNDASKGNCARCHQSEVKRGAFPQFTDRGFIALGVPRNPRIAANADPAFHDLGLCGPLRTDFADHPAYCGLFKTPTLRNVARRRVFFHNGAFHRLEDVLDFYARRDVMPDKFYGRPSRGGLRPLDDLPARYHANLDTEAPFDRKPGDRPAMSKRDIGDLIAFLKTLDDADADHGRAAPAFRR